jgi:small subunit ribosomal protein S17
VTEEQKNDEAEVTTNASEEAETATAEVEDNGRGNRKTVVGFVVSDKMSKTRIVKVQRLEMHRRYKKYVRRDSKFAAHDENEQGQEISKMGDKVLLQETRPYSKTKRWRIVKVLD